MINGACVFLFWMSYSKYYTHGKCKYSICIVENTFCDLKHSQMFIRSDCLIWEKCQHTFFHSKRADFKSRCLSIFTILIDGWKINLNHKWKPFVGIFDIKLLHVPLPYWIITNTTQWLINFIDQNNENFIPDFFLSWKINIHILSTTDVHVLH